jgi:diguanylate cyclase (GGDEF)-like protein
MLDGEPAVFLRALVEHAPAALVAVSADGRVRFHTRRAETLLNRRGETILDWPFVDLFGADEAPRIARFLEGLSHSPVGDSALIQVRWPGDDGVWRYVDITGVNLSGDPAVDGFLMHLVNASSVVNAEQELVRRSLVDDLTGLPNRRAARERLVSLLEAGDPATVMLADIDGFRRLNDSFGLNAGDEVLRVVAARFATAVRTSDLVARLNSDELVIVAPGNESNTWHSLVERVLASLFDEIEADGARIPVSVTIGVATSDGVEDADDLLRMADAALDEGKRSRPGGWTAWDHELEQWVHEARQEFGAITERLDHLRAENRRLSELARTSDKTGLPNKVAAADELPSFEAETRTRRSSYCVAFLDIDDFGRLNKDFTTAVGDEVLFAVGDALNRACRGDDRLYHRSGEEFFVVLPDTVLVEAYRVGERLRAAVASLRPPVVPRQVTVSVGVAAFDPDRDGGIEAVIDRADQAMQDAKRAGRDRVMLERDVVER